MTHSACRSMGRGMFETSLGKAIENLFVSIGQRFEGLHEFGIVLDALNLGLEGFEHE